MRGELTGEVTTVESKSLVKSELYHVRADFVHEVLRVGSDDENVVVSGQVGFEPYYGFEIQVCEQERSQYS